MAGSNLPSQAPSENLRELLARVSTGETRAFAELHTLTRSRLGRIAPLEPRRTTSMISSRTAF